MCLQCEYVKYQRPVYVNDPFDRSDAPYKEVFTFLHSGGHRYRITFHHDFEDNSFEFRLVDNDSWPNGVKVITTCPFCNRDLYIRSNPISIELGKSRSERKRIAHSNSMIGRIYNIIKEGKKVNTHIVQGLVSQKVQAELEAEVNKKLISAGVTVTPTIGGNIITGSPNKYVRILKAAMKKVALKFNKIKVHYEK